VAVICKISVDDVIAIRLHILEEQSSYVWSLFSLTVYKYNLQVTVQYTHCKMAAKFLTVTSIPPLPTHHIFTPQPTSSKNISSPPLCGILPYTHCQMVA
jgi:hypothetical protein